MKSNPTTLRDTDTVAKALEYLLKHEVLAIPVVDAAGRYLGMFGKHRFLSLLLPKAALLDEGVPSLAQLLDLAFMSDNLDDVRQRLAAIANNPVGQYAEKDAPVLEATAPLMKAMLLLYRTRNYLPVVD
ncbi:MAG: HPP family protein, partial [Alphaproteobacteria bacterium]